MLLQNKSFLACNGLRYLAGAPAVTGVLTLNDLGGTINTKRNRYIGEANMYKGDATPSGYTPTGGAWYPNRISGGMGSRSLIVGDGEITTISTILAGGLNGTVNMIGSGYINSLPYMKIADHFIVDVASLTSLGKISSISSMKGVVQFKPEDNIILTGEGTIPNVMLKILAWSNSILEGEGNLQGLLLTPVVLSATLLSEGNITYAALVGLVYLLGNVTGEGVIDPNLRFPANIASALEGSGTIPDTLLKAIAWCVSDILGEGTATDSDLRGKGFMDATITSQGEVLTAQSCAIAVWEELASAHLKEGTTGKALASAGTAGDPWSGIMSEYTDDATFGAWVKKLLSTGKFIALK